MIRITRAGRRTGFDAKPHGGDARNSRSSYDSPMTSAMSADTQRLIDIRPRHAHFVGVDSDGSVFDTMEIKQKRCFIPVTVTTWGLNEISAIYREVHEFVCLHSRWRGINRFLALLRIFDLLAECDEVRSRRFELPDLAPLRRFTESGDSLGRPSLEQIANETRDPILLRALEWTRAIDAAIEEVVKAVPPFPHARLSLAKLQRSADVVCISATPREALEREWQENDLAQYVVFIAGQEIGSKAQQLRMATAGKYDKRRVLMVGDALGDLEAARRVNACFYPISPGREELSWRRFHDEFMDRYLADDYTPEIEAPLIAQFEASLPVHPPWNQRAGTSRSCGPMT
jgi:phosphoglycolate phosphatase-like HAD superfamily hydrolase